VATLGIGVDIIDVPRFALVLERRPRIVERLFTPGEREDSKLRPERLAARFAAKEAVLKALQVGFGAAPWTSIEVRRDERRPAHRAARPGGRPGRASRRGDPARLDVAQRLDRGGVRRG